MESLDLDVAGDYVAEAAQLIQIKSRMLLPRPAAGPDGEPGEEDPRADLVQRLLEYRRLKDAAQALAEVDRVRQGIWTRRERWRPAPVEGDDPAAVEVDLGDVSLFDLMGAFRQALRRYEVEHPEPVRLHGEQFPVRGQVQRLLAALDPARPFDLIADLRARSCRAEVISTFLAMLELTRLNLVRVHQTAAGEILLYRTTRELGAAELEALPG
jgi:segregation and condensation protein A